MSHTIVVIDDDSITLDIIVSALEESLDVTVYSFQDSRMAKSFLTDPKAGRLDLVITDVQMPGYTGIEILAYMRRQQIKTPVMLVSAEGTREVAVEAKRFGANGFIVKPFKTDDLLQKVKTLLK
ncbi:response regulator [Alteromonas sediminis]|uniref:Response regulator n=1 Tax=Alteromonas sediminis TaxID=2259342 RepID=A0A3N5YL35_9ALTE|nr:response regulator [Alteromonas sediminis]RPJ65781.1 response regulator [Alteromonas sediminis]